MSSEKVQKLFNDAKFLADYSAWLKDPVTVKVFESALELAEPSSLQRPDPNAALYMHGVYVGFNKMLSFMRGAHDVLKSAAEMPADESYGESRVMDAMYPQIAMAKKRQKAPAA